MLKLKVLPRVLEQANTGGLRGTMFVFFCLLLFFFLFVSFLILSSGWLTLKVPSLPALVKTSPKTKLSQLLPPTFGTLSKSLPPRMTFISCCWSVRFTFSFLSFLVFSCLSFPSLPFPFFPFLSFSFLFFSFLCLLYQAALSPSFNFLSILKSFQSLFLSWFNFSFPIGRIFCGDKDFFPPPCIVW